jgi:TolA-binding protein
MTARWVPEDNELDAVARTLEANVPAPEIAEQLRTKVLANAIVQHQQSRRSAAPFAIAGVALAAAAAIIVWLGHSDHARPKQVIASIGVALFERTSDWPDLVVHLDDGQIDVQVAQLDAGDRFRVTTLDAEVEVRGAHFEVGAEHDRLQRVVVREGRVEVRPKDQQVVILSAGESWNAPKLVQRDEVLPPPTPATPATPATPPTPIVPASVPPIVAAAPTAHAKPPRVATSPEPVAPAPPAPAPLAPAVAPTLAKPGEAEFRAGWAALRTGDASAAAKAFSTACNEALHAPLGEDACFWTGAAAKRAGDAAAARVALEYFLKHFPTSPRATEASALLGWLLYDAGELDAAEQDFHRAEHDRVPKVRDSAQRGLTAIQRKRSP